MWKHAKQRRKGDESINNFPVAQHVFTPKPVAVQAAMSGKQGFQLALFDKWLQFKYWEHFMGMFTNDCYVTVGKTTKLAESNQHLIF